MAGVPQLQEQIAALARSAPGNAIRIQLRRGTPFDFD
jgi:hypothetical protein